LAGVGYWGLLVGREYGGGGGALSQFAKVLTQMATLDPTLAGLASVPRCIGAGDPVPTVGTPQQQKRLLAEPARGPPPCPLRPARAGRGLGPSRTAAHRRSRR